MINIFENSIEKKYSFYELVDGQYQLSAFPLAFRLLLPTFHQDGTPVPPFP